MYAKKNKKPMYEMGGKAADMIMKMMEGGMMPKYPGGGMMPRRYEEGGTEPEKVSAEELARRLAAMKGRAVTLDGVTRAMGGEETGYTTAVDATARPVMGIPVGMGEPAMEEPSAAPGRMEELSIRGPRAIKRGGDRELVGERQALPERQKEKDYGFQVMRDPDHFRHPYGKSITTAKTGEETDTSGMMGVRMGKTAYYMPNARGYTGPKGDLVRDFREIKDKFGEEAYMQALGMLQEQGADISRLVD